VKARYFEDKKMKNWTPCSDPPDGLVGKWSRDVVVITNIGNVYKLAHMASDGVGGRAGYWQRPSAFAKIEKHAFWIDDPRKGLIK
jgi:hypothetical protein